MMQPSQESIAIDLKQAIDIAREFILDIFASDAIQELTLEEVEMSDDANYWLVTFSFGRERAPRSTLEQFAVQTHSMNVYEKYYRTIQIDMAGKVKAMKIRSL